MQIREIKITDKDYFFAIENMIRDTDNGWAAYEAKVLLPVCETILEESGIKEEELKEYPVEGYYYKTPELKKYNKIIRNLQINFDLIPRVQTGIASFKIIYGVCSNPIFGPEVEENRAGKILPQRRDILSYCIANDSVWHHSSTERPWNIASIWKKIGDYKYGVPNLVELGYLTGELVCLACAAETNSLYREMYGYSGTSGGPPPISIPVWLVSPAVEAMGAALVKEYNMMIAAYNPLNKYGYVQDFDLLAPTPQIILSLPRSIKGTPRIARLGYNLFTGLNYSWIIPPYGGVKDFYSYRVITSEDAQDQKLTQSIMDRTYSDKPMDSNTPEVFGGTK